VMSISQRLRRAETRPFQEPGWDRNEAEFSLQRNRLRQNARVLKKPAPLTCTAHGLLDFSAQSTISTDPTIAPWIAHRG
jgi:hypothetical protein